MPTRRHLWASPVALVAKNLPEMQDIWIRSLGWEDPLEEGIATHFSILAWRIPWAEEPGRLQSIGSQRARHNRSNLTYMHGLQPALGLIDSLGMKECRLKQKPKRMFYHLLPFITVGESTIFWSFLTSSWNSWSQKQTVVNLTRKTIYWLNIKNFIE